VRVRFPNPFVLLTACILIAAALSWVVPAGQFDRRADPATGRQVVVAGTYHPVDPRPLGVFDALLAVPHGLIDAGSVVFFVFLIGGALTVVDETGALRHGAEYLVTALGARSALVIPIVSIAFATAGALENMQEEIIALVPVLLLVTRRLGYDAITAIAISIGASAVGAAFSPVNPFQAQIAQKVAGVALLSGAPYRLLMLAVALTIWIAGTWRHARRTRRSPDPSTVTTRAMNGRHWIVLAIVIAAFAVFVYGVIDLGWDFDQMAAVFLGMGILAGFAGGLKAEGTAEGFIKGFASMAYAAMVIGFARAIFVAMDQGRIVDTIVRALVIPLQHLPVALCAIGMMVVQALIHVPVPSVSGQAVLTMPLMVPISDLIGLSRQATVLAYQGGAGLTELVTPTNGAVVAVAAAAGVTFGEWLAFAVRLVAILFVVTAVFVAIAAIVGLA
jgi:uncharacterized ion transporter superfamily protein YfcC